MISTRLQQRFHVSRPVGMVGIAVVGLSLVTMSVTASTGATWAFGIAALVGYAADFWLHRTERRAMARLGKLRVGVSVRYQLRTALLLVLLVRMADMSRTVMTVATMLAVGLLAAPLAHGAICRLIRSRRWLPVATRNVDLSALRITNRPPRLLTDWPGPRLLQYELVVVAGLLGTTATGEPTWVLTAMSVALGVAVLTFLALLPFLRTALRMPGKEAVLAEVDEWLGTYRPETVLYFSGSQNSAYQVNMWLRTVEQLGSRPLVILRERAILPQLKPTSLPVICVPSAVHLMNMDLSTVRVALYPANVGKNIHLLRVPTIQHVFIGHGDSDKIASVNPYSKVYDEVWTAGEAGRQRYAEAAVGVEDRDIVEVGRPQLDDVTVVDEATPPAEIPTVLYAPTWEGWTDDPGNTSLILAGENIVRALLASERPIRVLYKPHPFTGTRSPAARAAHQRITALIEAANAERAASGAFRAEGGAPARQRLAELTERAAAFDHQRRPGGADEAMLTRDSTRPDTAVAAEAEALEAEWEQAYWDSHAPWQHQVITGPRPALYGCFDQADLLISDISSVVSDFIASLKPYALTDTAELGEAEFRRQNTAAGAAYLLTSEAKGVDHLLELLFDPIRDERREDRRSLKYFLLGPDSPSSMKRFDSAVEALADQADTLIQLRQQRSNPDQSTLHIPASLTTTSSAEQATR
ncbi:hypothetical protein ACIGW8_37760 [Streptomyces sioyaensis]|uniref:hypothetical protein n=1 Tax=Streptomyces sioyaensis TaxID=67364 RepID=UPI0037D7E99D